MADINFAEIKNQIEAGVLTEEDVKTYLAELGSAQNMPEEEIKKIREALYKYRDTVLVEDRKAEQRLDNFVQNTSPEEFNHKEALINRTVTAQKFRDENPQMMVFDEETNAMLSEYMALSTGFKALVDGPRILDEKMLDNASKNEAARTEYEIANGINQEYCTKQLESLAKQLEDEKDPEKRTQIETQIEKAKEQLIAPISGLKDLPKGINLKDHQESVSAYLGNKMAALQSTSEKISAKFKDSRLGRRLNDLDNKLLNSKGGKVYAVAKKVAKNAILNYGGLMACTAVLGPAGVPVYSSLKAIHMGAKVFRKSREDRKAAREEVKNLEENNNVDVNSEKAKILQAKIAAAKKRANQGFAGYLKNNPHELVGIGVSVLSAVTAGYIAIDGGTEIASATKLGERFSARTITGAVTSVLGGIANTGVDLGKALKAKTKEERRLHLKAAAKHFTMGLAAAAAGLGIGGLIKAHTGDVTDKLSSGVEHNGGEANAPQISLGDEGVKAELEFFAKMHPRGFNEVLGQKGNDWEVSRELLGRIEKGDIPQEKLQQLLETKRALVDEKLGYLNPEDKAAAIAAQEARNAAKAAAAEIAKGAVENSSPAPQVDYSNMSFEQQNAAYQRQTLDTVLNDNEKARLDEVVGQPEPKPATANEISDEIKQMHNLNHEIIDYYAKRDDFANAAVEAQYVKSGQYADDMYNILDIPDKRVFDGNIYVDHTDETGKLVTEQFNPKDIRSAIVHHVQEKSGDFVEGIHTDVEKELLTRIGLTDENAIDKAYEGLSTISDKESVIREQAGADFDAQHSDLGMQAKLESYNNWEKGLSAEGHNEVNKAFTELDAQKTAEVKAPEATQPEVKEPEVKESEVKAPEPKTPEEYAKAVAEGKMTREEAIACMRKAAEERIAKVPAENKVAEQQTNGAANGMRVTTKTDSTTYHDGKCTITIEKIEMSDATVNSVEYDNYLRRQDAFRAHKAYGLTDKQDIDNFCEASRQVRENGGSFVMKTNEDGSHEFFYKNEKDEMTLVSTAPKKNMSEVQEEANTTKTEDRAAARAARREARRMARSRGRE